MREVVVDDNVSDGLLKCNTDKLLVRVVVGHVVARLQTEALLVLNDGNKGALRVDFPEQFPLGEELKFFRFLFIFLLNLLSDRLLSHLVDVFGHLLASIAQPV